MTKTLTQIALDIARLPSFDQRWILRHLSDTQLDTLKRSQGLELLQQAQRFRSLKPKHLLLTPQVSYPLPAYCQQLANKTPLYAAIVIQQGTYPWQVLFLQKFDKEGLIQTEMDNQVPNIKPLTKQTLFHDWEQTISFEACLDEIHG